jgi:hypothetical protein
MPEHPTKVPEQRAPCFLPLMYSFSSAGSSENEIG